MTSPSATEVADPRAPRPIAATKPAGTRTWDPLWSIAFALLVYVPIIAMHPGRVETETKTYLYLDPSRLLTRAFTLWTPTVGFGTMSHQTAGYLFPMGPFYWVLESVLGVPAWIAQRLWLATIIVLAGFGMRYLLRTLGLRGAGVSVAMLAYAFSPYVLGNSALYSPLLGPWAALPWWIGFMVLGLRERGWKYPSLFALSVLLVAALNGTALLYCLAGPALWLLYSLFVTRESTWSDTWALVWRTSVLTFFTSIWWVASLLIEGKYGLNILRYTESIEVVSVASTPFEILRGLGNWFFYGRDALGPWSDARAFYTQRFWLIFVSFLVPALAMLAAAVTRWRYRTFFVIMVLLGVAIGVGASPYANPSPLGGAYKSFALTSALGFALRNTVRAVPLVALGVAVLLAVGVNAVADNLRGRSWPAAASWVAAGVGVLCLVAAYPALAGHYYNRSLERGESIPQYWQKAVNHLDAESHATRVLALPGSPFATYRWGDLKDPLEPGLMDRPYADRELVPQGSAAPANLVQALDHRLQEQDQRIFEPAAVAPVARLMGVGDVEVRNDLQVDQYGLIQPAEQWRSFTEPRPSGLGPPSIFGSRIPGRLKYPAGDLSHFGPQVQPPPVAVFPVEDPLPIVRTKSPATPVVVDGDGEGVVDLAAGGLLDPNRLLVYSAAHQSDPSFLRRLAPGSTLVLTDSNRRRAMRWSGMTNNFGYTELAGEKPLVSDPLDQRLEVFPDSTDAVRTVTVLSGVKSVQATTYGAASFDYNPKERPALALDGNPRTAWLAFAGQAVDHPRLRIVLEHRVTTDHVNLSQVASLIDQQLPAEPRYVTSVTLRFDGGDAATASLNRSSRTIAGQDVHFGRRTFTTLDITIDGVHGNLDGTAGQKNPVGFNEVRIRDSRPGSAPVQAVESQRLPTDLLTALGTRSASHPLAIVLSREATMDGSALRRTFTLPTARSFTLQGSAILGPKATDGVVSQTTGHVPATAGGVTTASNLHLDPPGSRSSSAVDGDPRTAWMTPVDKEVPTMSVTVPDPITFGHLDLQVVADGRHSVPRQLVITADDGTQRVVALPVAGVPRQPDGTKSVPVDFEPVHGRTFIFTIANAVTKKSGGVARPEGIAELGIPGVRQAAPPADLSGQCRDDLVEVDGKPVPVRITGSTGDALAQRPLTLSQCDPGTPLDLSAGRHTIVTEMSPFNPTGFDVNRLVLSSAAGGAAQGAAQLTATPTGGTASSPRVHVLKNGATSMTLRVDHASGPFWLVLGQSFNQGWVAKAGGRELPAPTLVDGFANGWKVTPSGNGPMTVTLTWTPQKTFTIALVISIVATLVCLGIVVFAFVRRRRRTKAATRDQAAGADPGEAVRTFPRLVPTLFTAPLPPRRGATVAAVAISGVASALLVRPWVGLLVAALVLLAIRSPKSRLVLRFGPPLIVLGVALYMTIEQRVHGYAASFDWVTRFSGASVVVWIAVMLLASDALISMLWRREPDPGPEVPA
jgi:arabinofuranan 3-O-arabinosyltransferase